MSGSEISDRVCCVLHSDSLQLHFLLNQSDHPPPQLPLLRNKRRPVAPWRPLLHTDTHTHTSALIRPHR